MLGTVLRGLSAGADELVECESVSECSGSDTVFIALAPDSFQRGVDGASADKKPFSSRISEGRDTSQNLRMHRRVCFSLRLLRQDVRSKQPTLPPGKHAGSC